MSPGSYDILIFYSRLLCRLATSRKLCSYVLRSSHLLFATSLYKLQGMGDVRDSIAFDKRQSSSYYNATSKMLWLDFNSAARQLARLSRRLLMLPRRSITTADYYVGVRLDRARRLPRCLRRRHLVWAAVRAMSV